MPRAPGAPVIKISDGGAYAEISGDLEAFVRRTIEASNAGLFARVEKATREIAADGQDQWPVKTGESKKAITVEYRVDLAGCRVIGVISNPVPYAYYIKPKVLHGATTAWQRYIRGPAKQAQEYLALDLVEDLINAVREEGHGG